MGWIDSVLLNIPTASGGFAGTLPNTPPTTPAGTGIPADSKPQGSFAETFNAVTSGTSDVINALTGLFSFGKKTDSGMPLPPDDTDDYSGGSGSGSWDTKKILITTVIVLTAVAAVIGGIFFIKKHKKA